MIKELLKKKERYAHAVGPAIRARRKDMGMTMQQLADKCELSSAFISLVERGKSSFSLVSLQSIAEALEVEIGYFIDVPEGEGLVHRANKPEYLDIDHPVKYRLLSSQFPNQKMEQLITEVPPHYRFPYVKREGEGFIYVLEGRLAIKIGEEETVLDEGDSVHFDYQMGVDTENPTDALTRLLWCGSPAWLHQNLSENSDK
ncbi:XRE family transcriptional regulator [Pseudomaricurvus alkylphenolicus]|jgi:transcriptional regulator with XRE-family HTH domain|uniref:helix-turn-helix domain-containing protein n=1 Tax=Pseudomaricurvus alkylphenolicus TaxID=1306991 RepID=UPI00142498CB|nr:XRE family transcriptional regulator [Pseudomaricurvus alkylphenolicus]NIB40491.1 XRE family transcriptional regulator [Pseudomaricurvus alkylphenolicus]